MANEAGRPTKLTDEMQERICENIRRGLGYREAAVAAGISERTFYNWKSRGENAKSGIHLQFLQALQEAEAIAELVLLEIIQNATKKDWRAATWILERRHPRRWAQLQKREISGAGGGPLVIKLEWSDDADDPGTNAEAAQ